MPSFITLFCFDFSGCGLSEGEYISLGWFEKEDIEEVVDFLRKSNKVSTIGLWGRSMGAATSLMHAKADPSIAGLVLDSAFTDLKTLAEELCKTYANLPKLVVTGAMAIVRKTIQNKAKFDINNLCPISHVKEAFIPALFVHGKDDSFIKPHHTQKLYDEYSGDKNIVFCEGDHNSTRPGFLFDSIGIFFYNTLQVKMLVPDSANSVGMPKSCMGLGMQKNAYMNGAGIKIGNEAEIGEMLGEWDEKELEEALKESLKISEDVKEKEEKKKN